ncbi:insecticyanin-A-like [Zerene cesonia]|uniref:insecticyanin-A-like n=1 Tax=Zerene cesonia TaxID=33412 RepID=UPI0018E5A50E|nr:insecticyanin-A-like [Zerene cesonia]
MINIIVFCVFFTNAYGYFTIPGKCPENIALQEDFRIADFYGKWYQAYHFSSDGQNLNNCSTLELMTRPSGIYLNQSRVDRGLFHRYSIGKVEIPTRVEDAANLELTFAFKNAPRRLKTRKYPFKVLATNYNYYATIYTCQYSPLIDKHFMYIWILSRNPVLNMVSKELSMKPLQQFGVNDIHDKMVKEDRSKCAPKYYDDVPLEPVTFRFPVPI